MESQCVGIMANESSDLLIGLLSILKSGNCFVPINPLYPAERINFLINDCNIKLLLTDSPNYERAQQAARDNPGLLHVLCIPQATVNVNKNLLPKTGSIEERISPDQLCYIIYTSGSTGKPKGVPITHRNLTPLLLWFRDYFNLGQNTKILQTLSYTFDFGVFEIFSTLLFGGTIYFKDLKQMTDLSEYPDLINEYEINTIHTTPSFFNSIIWLDKKMPTLKRLHFGGEKLTVKMIQETSRLLEGEYKIYNGYGPTETTINSTIFSITPEVLPTLKAMDSIPIGRSSAGNIIYILDNLKHLLPIGVPGEICIAGGGVARGYLNRPELTAKKFGKAVNSHWSLVISSSLKTNDKLSKSTNDQCPMTNDCSQKFLSKDRSSQYPITPKPHYPIYMTGDRGRWLHDGNVEYLGRMDDQVKVRGFRIEPGEIENCLLNHEKIREAAVKVKEDDRGDKYLCAYFVPGDFLAVNLSSLELKEFLSAQLPDHMIPSFFVSLEKIPLSPSGKIDRKALPEPAPIDEAAAVPPQTPIQERMQKIWQEVLGLESIGIYDNFFAIGGHSLKATILVSKIHQAFNVKIPLAEIFKTPTIKGLSGYIAGSVIQRFASIPPQELKEYYALSSAQKRFYILQQMEIGTTAYNIPQVVILTGDLKKENIADTFRKLIRRHESIRTSFEMIDETPVQKIHSEFNFEIEYFPLGINRVEVENMIQGFVRWFDLTKAPLMRVGLIKTGKKEHILMIDIHHIISDALSQQVFVKELMTLYEGKKLLPLKLHYKDYAEWKSSRIERETVKKQEGYWLNEFLGEIPILDLPLDYKRPTSQRFEGSSSSFKIGKKETGLLKALASRQGLTLFMVLLGIYNIFLSKISSQEGIVIGTPTSGRRHVELEPIIGIFINTLALKNYPCGTKTCKEFFREVKVNTLQAFENQDYQFEDLVDRVVVNRDASRNPLFDTMFIWNNADITDMQISNLALTPYVKESVVSKFDLTLSAVEMEDRLGFSFEYCTKLFKKETIQRFVTYFKNVLYSAVKRPGQQICDIEIITEAEKQWLLFQFNAFKAHCPGKKIQELFEEQVERTPDNIAVVGPLPVKYRTYMTHMTYISYRQLNRKSGQLEVILRKIGVQSDSIVAIMVERSIEMIVGILGILKSGGAYLPIDPGYPQERIDYMLADSAAKILLTADAINRVPTPPLLHLSPAPVTCLAYVIYTSGSTGKPKGVLVEHRPVVNILSALQTQYPIKESDTYLLKTTYVFDVSVTELFGWFLGGGRLAILSKDGEKDPGRIIEAIECTGVSHINFVPSMFKVFVDELNPGNINKLSALKYIFLAGEVLIPEMVDKFRRLNTTIKLENIYGPTEAAVYSSKYSLLDWKGGECIPIGKCMQNINLYILDKYNHLQPVELPGELCIGGAGVARGYLNRPGLTAEKFDQDLLDYQDYHDEKNQKFLRGSRGQFLQKALPGRRRQKIYKTGDLARWLADGNIEYLGRMDSQVKIRGFRIEPGEVQHRLLQHEEIKEAVIVVWRGKNNDNQLCAYVVTRTPHTAESLKSFKLGEYLSQQLPAYMVPTWIIPLERIPLTPSGKVDGKALPEPGFTREELHEHEVPRNLTEKKLTEIWGNTFSIDPGNIGIDDRFFELGGHSLNAVIMLSKIHKALNVKIPLSQVFNTPTIRGLAEYIREAAGDRYVSIEPVEKKEYYALSSSQKRLFILHQLEPVNTYYNIPYVLPWEEEIDKERLEITFKRLIARHESLRTSFPMTGSQEPVQRIHDEAEFEIEYYETGKRQKAKGNKEELMPNTYFLMPESLLKNFIRPFDLSKVPLLRAALVKTIEEKYLLLVDMHHIITDGTSQAILTREFIAFYSGEELTSFRIQYKDFSEWQNKLMNSGRIRKQESYWLKKFQSEIPVLDLPIDHARPVIQSFEGSMIHFEIGKEEIQSLKKCALAQGASLYMVLLSLTSILLSKLSGQEDIIIGTPVVGRRHADLEKIIGMFVNTLPLRNEPTAGKTFNQFIKEVRESTLEALENQEYPFEEIVDRAAVNRDTSRNPLFDVMLVFQNFTFNWISPQASGREQQPFIGCETNTAKFDITMNVSEDGEGLALSLQYSTALFKKKTIERFIRYFKKIVSIIITESGIKLGQIEIISEEERKQILDTFNDTDSEYPKHTTIHQLFEEQVKRTPERTALVGSGSGAGGKEKIAGNSMQLTYRELKEKANKLAQILQKKGVKPDDIVGIMSERSIEMVVGIFSILMAGGAYVPIEPEYPGERITFILENSGAKLLLTKKELINKIDNKCEIIDIKSEDFHKVESKDLAGVNRFGDLVYVIYTSGSTGKPKGVMVEHQSLVNRLNWMQGAYPISKQDVLLHKTPFVFDVSLWELFWWSIQGSSVCLLNPGGEKNPGEIVGAIENNKITTIHFVPSMLNAFLDYIDASVDIKRLAGLRQVFASGEPLLSNQVEKFNRLLNKKNETKLINLYGPTEATVDVSYYNCATWGKTFETVPIGKPIDNIRLHVFDRGLHLQPIGITGELAISGVGLARGYLNNPELTAEKFKRAVISYSSLVIGSSSKLSTNVQCPMTNDRPYKLYLTGDLVRWLPDGNLEFLGRMDHQVKIRGFRIELGEIEAILLTHPGIKETVVVAGIDNTGDRYLCAYIVSHKEPGISELQEYLSGYLPDYMIPAYFVSVEKIPLTPNGKIDRRALPAPELTKEQKYAPPRDEIERKLAKIWTGVLGIIDMHISIGVYDNFFELGGHSLKAIILLSKIHKEFDVKLPLVEIFKTPFISGLAAAIKAAKKDKYESMAATEKKEYYLLSSAQQRFFILQQMDPDSTAYNIPMIVALKGKLNKQWFEAAFATLIDRHDSLRTSFRMKEDTPVQKVHDKVEFEIEYYDFRVTGEGDRCRWEEINCQCKGKVPSPVEIGTIIRGFIRLFDLSRAPLLRVGLIKPPHTPSALRGHPSQEGRENEYLLMVDMHHIVSDGISIRQLTKDFLTIYSNEEFQPLQLQYKDYCEWQHYCLTSGKLTEQENYWLNCFSGNLPVLRMPTDYPRPSIQQFEGDSIGFHFGKQLSQSLNQLMRETDTTLYMVLLAVYNILLSKYSGQEDIIIGTPTAGRNHAALENVIGLLMETFAIRNYPTDDKVFEEFLAEVKKNALDAFENQGYPFGKLLKHLWDESDRSRNPLFDAMLTIQNLDADTDLEESGIGPLKLVPYEDDSHSVSKVDLTLVAFEREEKIFFILEYCTALFKRDTMERFISSFKKIVSTVVDNKKIKLADIQISHDLLAAVSEKYKGGESEFQF